MISSSFKKGDKVNENVEFIEQDYKYVWVKINGKDIHMLRKEFEEKYMVQL